MKQFTLLTMAFLMSIVMFAQKGNKDVTIDFNAMTDEPTSSGNSTDGDILVARDFTAGDVTLTVSPKAEGASNENRLWATSKGPQLRVYSGTLTFQVPANKVLTSIEFNTSKWNANNSADCGVLEGKTWSDDTGEVQKVVFTIAANSQINSITIFCDDKTPTTGVSDIKSTANDKLNGKFFENGRMVIMKNGIRYNAAGQRMK